jgi:hypothetical protein
MRRAPMGRSTRQTRAQPRCRPIRLALPTCLRTAVASPMRRSISRRAQTDPLRPADARAFSVTVGSGATGRTSAGGNGRLAIASRMLLTPTCAYRRFFATFGRFASHHRAYSSNAAPSLRGGPALGGSKPPRRAVDKISRALWRLGNRSAFQRPREAPPEGATVSYLLNDRR